MDRLTLERNQVWIYLSAIVLGLLVGRVWPGVGPTFEALLWPILMVLLYATFAQVPLLHLHEAFRDHRFVAAVLTGNFIVVPAVVWTIVQWLPPEPAMRLGVLLVLLVPCTDWFITFCQLGGGNVPRAVAVTPINLFLQLLLLPVYLWLMAESTFSAVFTPAQIRPAIAKLFSHLFKLPTEQARTLTFSLGTRNSFLVLPFALSLPPGWEVVGVVIVIQSLVELFGMTFYLWWVPQKLFPTHSRPSQI